MSHRRNNTTTPTRPPPPAGQRSYVVSIDAGAFANVEIVVGGYHRGGVWTPSRAATVKATSKSHVYAYVSTTPSTPSTKPTPFSPLPSQPASARSPSSASSAWSNRTHGTEREYVAAQQQQQQHRTTAEQRAREQLQRRREREEARRLAEARRAAAAALAAEEEEARQRRRRRHVEQQQHEQQKRLLREERRRLERKRRAREIASAWSSYEARWSLLSQRQPLGAPLTFERIPWPVAAADAVPPLDGRRTRRALVEELLRPEAIREFLLSPAHSPEVSSKDRIRAALRRWHPDKFARVLGQVVESDKGVVAEGMGIVARCLNDMLERENHA